MRFRGMPATPETAWATIPLATFADDPSDFHGGMVFTAPSPDGRLLAISDWGRLQLFDTETFEQIHELPSSGNLLRFSPDGRLLISGEGYCYCGAADESYQVGFASVWAVQ